MLPIQEPIYEFGSRQVPGQEGFADLRPYFPGMEYIGCDIVDGPGVDCLMDVQAIDLADGIAGTALCMGLLEHVEYPRLAVQELARILNPEGILILNVPGPAHPVHNYPADYWRFTPMSVESLLIFTMTVVEWGYEGQTEGITDPIVGIGFKQEARVTPELIEELRMQIREVLPQLPEEEGNVAQS